MKKLVFTLAIGASVIFGFSNCQAKTESNNSNSPTKSVAQNDHAAVKMTKAMFIDRVWDYEKSPEQWKFKGNKPILIDFYADWCGPCRTAAPILEEVAAEYKGKVEVYKIDTQVERELAGVFGVRGIPAFLYIPVEGKPTMTSGIGRTKTDTKKMFEDNIAKILSVKKPTTDGKEI